MFVNGCVSLCTKLVEYSPEIACRQAGYCGVDGDSFFDDADDGAASSATAADSHAAGSSHWLAIFFGLCFVLATFAAAAFYIQGKYGVSPSDAVDMVRERVPSGDDVADRIPFLRRWLGTSAAQRANGGYATLGDTDETEVLETGRRLSVDGFAGTAAYDDGAEAFNEDGEDDDMLPPPVIRTLDRA